jgi:hypothetical protein
MAIFDLVMTTVSRPEGEDYVHRALQSLFAASRNWTAQVHLFVGGRDSSYLHRYRTDPRIAFHPIAKADLEQIDGRGLIGCQRANYAYVVNFHRAIGLPPLSPGSLLVSVEDDVIFDAQFWPRLEAAAAECARCSMRFLLTLYSTHAVERAGNETVVPYPDPAEFYGTQGVLYSPRVRAELPSYIGEAGVLRNEEPVDRLLRTFAVRTQTPIWQTYRSLVQHIGQQTTGVFTHWHTSPTFGLPWQGRQAGASAARAHEQIEGWFDFPDVYDQAVAEAGDGARFVEVGALLGKSTVYLAAAIAASGKTMHCDVVDKWTLAHDEPGYREIYDKYGASTFETFQSNLDRFGLCDVVNPIRADSVATAERYADGSLDFVFIDADHSYDAVRADIAAWLPKVKARGILAGHDYDAGTHRSVVLAVDTALPLSQIERRGRSWLFRNSLPECGHFVVPLPAVERSYVLAIPYVNRPDLLQAAVQSVTEHWQSVVVIDQSDEGLGDHWQRQVAIYRWMAPRRFTCVQNFIQRLALLERVPHFLFMHSDAECLNDAIRLLLDEASRLDAEATRWDVIFTDYDALCLFSSRAVLATGAWDETFQWSLILDSRVLRDE